MDVIAISSYVHRVYNEWLIRTKATKGKFKDSEIVQCYLNKETRKREDQESRCESRSLSYSYCYYSTASSYLVVLTAESRLVAASIKKRSKKEKKRRMQASWEENESSA